MVRDVEEIRGGSVLGLRDDSTHGFSGYIGDDESTPDIEADKLDKR